ncbi:AAA family ATPase [Tritonibacter mobilis]|uniref:AAA family ATPase n=1 Tax=Tritonibacter mobilis TaxID=379347 RepID=UPI0001B8A572|nr:conserved hypothetical protein [Ruegeria sp. TrichCH4B]
MSDHFFVVTGGPGAGKTSLITELACRGFHTVLETGRTIIREEMQNGGHGCWSGTCAPTAPHGRSQAP